MIRDNVTSLEAHKLADIIVADWVATQSGEEARDSLAYIAALEQQRKDEFRATIDEAQRIARDRWERMRQQ